jgi:hypothetical protein
MALARLPPADPIDFSLALAITLAFLHGDSSTTEAGSDPSPLSHPLHPCLIAPPL